MISCNASPPCSYSSGLLEFNTPSSPSSSFGTGLRRRPAATAAQQRPDEHARGHTTRTIAAASASCAASGTPLPGHPATAVPQTQQQGHIGPQQGRCKIGRPIEFTGDINTKDLTDADRRRLKRRVANRESARRVRQRRQETLCTTQASVEELQARIVGLTAQLHQSDVQRAQLMQQVADLACVRAAAGDMESAAPSSQTASEQAAAGCGLPDTFKPDSVAARQLGAAAGAIAGAPLRSVVTGGTPRSSSHNNAACAAAHTLVPRACSTVTTMSSSMGACSTGKLGSSYSGGVVPPPLPVAANGAAGRAAIVSVTPSTVTTRLTCAVPPPAFPACDWGTPLADQGLAYQAPSLLPDPHPTGAEEDFLAGKAFPDLDVLLLPPAGSL